MVEYRLYGSHCEDHGLEWFVYLVHTPRWAKLFNRTYFGLLRFLGNPQTCVKEKDDGLMQPNFWGWLFGMLKLPFDVQEKVFDFQFWLENNRLATIAMDWELDLGIWIPVSEEAAATLDPAWVADEVANKTLKNVDNPDDIEW